MNPIFKTRNYINVSQYDFPELYLSILNKTAHPFIMKLNSLGYKFNIDGGAMGRIGILTIFKYANSLYIPFRTNGEFIPSEDICKFMSNNRDRITDGSLTYLRLNLVHTKAKMIELFGIDFAINTICEEFSQVSNPTFEL